MLEGVLNHQRPKAELCEKGASQVAEMRTREKVVRHIAPLYESTYCPREHSEATAVIH